jgi:truncated hemoglobin YjbI
MNASVVTQIPKNQVHLNDTVLIASIVDLLYEKMLNDYRINRFFFTRPLADQAGALKNYIGAVLQNPPAAAEQVFALLDDYFTISFARTNAKPNLVSGSDFAFLLDIVGGRDIRHINLLCLGHSHLMRLLPEDEHYDVVMAHLAESLQELGIAAETAARVMAFAETGREGLMGRGPELSLAA